MSVLAVGNFIHRDWDGLLHHRCSRHYYHQNFCCLRYFPMKKRNCSKMGYTYGSVCRLKN
jgi:hypothetical protein